MNEVQITESEFTTVKNVQALAKDAINSATRQMLQEVQEWPFLLTTTTQTLTNKTPIIIPITVDLTVKFL